MFLQLADEQRNAEVGKLVSLYLSKGGVAVPGAPEGETPEVKIGSETQGDVIVFRCTDGDGTTYAVGHAFVADTKEDGKEVVQAYVHQPMTMKEPKALYLYDGKAWMRRRGF